jgi:hypothetical protein
MKNETKGIAPLIIAIVVIVVAAGVGVGAYVATRGGTGGGGGGGDIAGATNLSFTMTSTAPAMALTFKAKDIGASTMKMRIDMTAPTAMSYIINGAQQSAWVYTAAIGWYDMSSTFSTLWDTYSTMFSGYQTDLAGVTGDTWTDGITTISNISTAAISDGLFTH